jgi:hypothetical protein
VSLAATFAIVAAAALLPQGRELRLWGINHLAFYSWPVKLGALALMALAFVPAIARAAYGGIDRFHGLIATGGSRSNLVIGIISVVSVFFFYHARAATHLLGDGALLVQSFEASYAGHATVMMRSVGAILANDQINPGTTLVFYWAVKAAVTVFNVTVTDGLILLPCLLGGVFVFLLMLLLRRARFQTPLGTWLLVLGVSTASLVYAPIFIVLSAYVITSFSVIHRRRRLWLPVVLLVASCFLHIQSVVFAPSLLFLLMWHLARGRRRLIVRYGAPALAVLTLVLAAAARAVNVPGDFYLPLTADTQGYGVVSPGHLLDMINEVLLLFPVALFAGAAWWVSASSRRRGEKTRSEGEWFSLPVEWRFVLLMLFPCLLYMTLFKPEIGMARDWDLFTMTWVAIAPLTLLVVNRYLAAAHPSVDAFARASVPAMVIALVLGMSWFGVNASSDRTTDRYESILAYDQTHVGYAYENLASYYESKGMLPKAIGAMEAGARSSGNPRIYARLAALYDRNGDTDGAIEMLYDTLSKHPAHAKVRAKLLELLEKRFRVDELMEVAREGVRHNPTDPVFHFALGESLIRTGDIDAGLELFRTCLTLNPPAAAREHMLARFREHGRQP